MTLNLELPPIFAKRLHIPLFRKIYYFPYFDKEFTCFSILYVFSFPSYFDHDTFMHHTMEVLDAHADLLANLHTYLLTDLLTYFLTYLLTGWMIYLFTYSLLADWLTFVLTYLLTV